MKAKFNDEDLQLINQVKGEKRSDDLVRPN